MATRSWPRRLGRIIFTIPSFRLEVMFSELSVVQLFIQNVHSLIR